MPKENTFKIYHFDNADFITASFQPAPRPAETKIQKQSLTADELWKSNTRLPLYTDNAPPPIEAATPQTPPSSPSVEPPGPQKQPPPTEAQK